MKRIGYILIINITFFQSACKKEELQTGVYSIEFLSSNKITINKDPHITLEKLPGDTLLIEGFLKVPQKGDKINADIACCTTAFYAAYELVIDGTFRTQKGVSSIEDTYLGLAQFGPFSGTFKMLKIE